MNVPLTPPSSAAPAKPLSTQWAMKRLRDAEPLQPVEAAIDVGPGAVGRLRAAERVRGLDADHDRELALLDDPPGRGRALDDPEPAFAGAAALRVDVALQGAQPADLERDRVHLVAGVRSLRLDPADRLVLDRLRDDDPLARPSTPARASGSRSAGGCWCR